MVFLKKIRFLFRLALAFYKRWRKTIFLGLLLGISCYFLIPRLIPLIPTVKKTEKIGLVGQFTVENLPNKILNDISYGLTTLSSKGNPEPALAEKWESLDGGKTFIFNIKTKNLFWHDGKAFALKDINYNFKDVDISIDENKIAFSLKDPFAPLPAILSKPLFKNGLIGLGNYKVKKIIKSGRFIKEIFLSSLLKDAPDKIYRFYKNESDLKIAFNLGEVDIIENIFDLNGFSLGKAVSVEENIIKNVFVGIFFNNSKIPFKDKAFRQALAYSLTKPSGEERALGPLNPDSWAYNPDVKPYNYDLLRARELLEKEKESLNNLKIVISAFPQYESIANQAKEDWKKLGIESEVRIVSFLPEDFDVLIIAREIPEDPDQYYFWHSSQIEKGNNIAKYDNNRIDKLLEDGRTTYSKEERKNIYFDFQRFLVEDSPVIFYSHPKAYTLIRK